MNRCSEGSSKDFTSSKRMGRSAALEFSITKSRYSDAAATRLAFASSRTGSFRSSISELRKGVVDSWERLTASGKNCEHIL